MKITILSIIIIIFIFITGCTTNIPARKDYLFVPVHFAYFSNEEVGEFTYDPATWTFNNVPENTTTAFYKSGDMTTYKKAHCNNLYFLTTKKEEINRFDPNREDLLVMKTGFTEGHSQWMFFISVYREDSYPNEYYKNIYFDINKNKGDYLETSFAILAINIGNTPIYSIYIADVMPKIIEINGKIKYAVNDVFLPLNVELEKIQSIEHKVIEKDDLRIVVYQIIPKETGILPGHCVEIIIPVKILKSSLAREEYKVDE